MQYENGAGFGRRNSAGNDRRAKDVADSCCWLEFSLVGGTTMMLLSWIGSLAEGFGRRNTVGSDRLARDVADSYCWLEFFPVGGTAMMLLSWIGSSAEGNTGRGSGVRPAKFQCSDCMGGKKDQVHG